MVGREGGGVNYLRMFKLSTTKLGEREGVFNLLDNAQNLGVFKGFPKCYS